MVGFSELFEMDHTPEDEIVFIEQIKSSSASLLKLINDILFLSRLDAGMITIKPQPVDFAAICEERCEAVWHDLKKPGVEYIVRNPYKRMVVDVDDSNLSLVIDKVITNAVQYTQKGSVEVRYDYMGDQLIVSVEDTGSGIPAETADHIFERFYKADTARNSKGSGLGLAIAYEITKSLDEKLWVESEYGHGAAFFCTIHFK